MKELSQKDYEQARHNNRQYIPWENHTDNEELNESIRQHREAYRPNLTKTALEVYQFIGNHSVVIKGVSWMKNAYIRKNLPIKRSDKAIRNAINQLVDYGMLVKYRTQEKGRFGHNIYVIPNAATERGTDREPHSDAELGDGTSKETHVKQNTSTCTLDESYLPPGVPDELAAALKPFYDANTIYEFYRRAIVARRSLSLTAPLVDVIDDVVGAAKATVFKVKRGVVRNLFAYFYSVTYNELMPAKRKEVAATGGGGYEWWLTE